LFFKNTIVSKSKIYLRNFYFAEKAEAAMLILMISLTMTLTTILANITDEIRGKAGVDGTSKHLIEA
jgi:hypothetical protein